MFSSAPPPLTKIVLAEGELINCPRREIFLWSVQPHLYCTSALTPHYIFQNGSHTTPAGIPLISTSGIIYVCVCVCVCGVIKGSGEKVRPECVCMFISTGPVIFNSCRHRFKGVIVLRRSLNPKLLVKGLPVLGS